MLKSLDTLVFTGQSVPPDKISIDFEHKMGKLKTVIIDVNFLDIL